MAMALAAEMFKSSALVDSAGVQAIGNPKAATEAIDVLAKLYAIDLSGHRPKNVESQMLSQYDFVIALSGNISRILVEEYGLDEKKLTIWEISDPFGCGEEAYKSAVESLEENLRRLQENLFSA